MLGLQSWIALPAGAEEIAPSFQHYAAESLPTVKDGGFNRAHHRRSGFGVKSPVTMVSPWFYTEVTAVAGNQRAARCRSRRTRDLCGRWRSRGSRANAMKARGC